MQVDVSCATWQFASFVVLTAIVSSAVARDIRERRIPNSLVILTLCSGIFLNALGPVSPLDGGGLFTRNPGALGFGGAMLGAIVGLGVFLPFHLLRIMGAGDVKFMAGIGSFVGAAGTLSLALFILAMGGVLAVLYMLWTRSSRQVLFNVSMAVSQVLMGGNAKFDPSQTAYRMPYTVAIACGMLAYGLWHLVGGKQLIWF